MHQEEVKKGETRFNRPSHDAGAAMPSLAVTRTAAATKGGATAISTPKSKKHKLLNDDKETEEEEEDRQCGDVSKEVFAKNTQRLKAIAGNDDDAAAGPPPFGLSTAEFEDLCSLPSVDFACRVISITLDYYESLPCPEFLPNGAANVWKMSVFTLSDPLSTLARETATLTTVLTLWDEAKDTYYGAPTKACVLVATSPFYVDNGVIDVIGIIGCLNTVAIPSAFGRGMSRKMRKLGSTTGERTGASSKAKKDVLPPLLHSGAYGESLDPVRPHKLIVHDATLQNGLCTFQIPPAVANNNDMDAVAEGIVVDGRYDADKVQQRPLALSKSPNVVAHVQVRCPKLAKGWDEARLVCICAYCRSMGTCKAGPGEMRVMRRCSACRISY